MKEALKEASIVTVRLCHDDDWPQSDGQTAPRITSWQQRGFRLSLRHARQTGRWSPP